MMISKIYSVDTVHLTLINTELSRLVVCAEGRAVSTGWRSPLLSPHIYLTPPKDGIQDYEFLADPPDGIVLPVLTPMHVDLVIDPIDVANHWGADQPLKGVRIHAVANTKAAPIGEQRGMPGASVHDATPTYPPVMPEGPSFETDIKPLFRQRDVSAMVLFRGWSLHVYDDVKASAEDIHRVLADGTMPCDGAWPEADIDLFRAWIDAGMRA